MVIRKLKEKNSLDLSTHLLNAIKRKEVNDTYIPFKSKTPNESNEEFVQRVVDASTRYQFVKVAFKDKIEYVAFHLAESPIITKYGKFNLLIAEVVGGRWGAHYILIYPDIKVLKSKNEIFIRTDSGCYSGMVLGDNTCDCASQLREVQRLCVKNGSGIIIHMPNQDGRGWGNYKLSNQKIMDELNVNTVEAARMFYGHEEEIDQRTYTEVVIILKALDLNDPHTFNLATNNPKKIQAFIDYGMNVSDTQSISATGISRIARKNLNAKSKNWKHDLKKNSFNLGG